MNDETTSLRRGDGAGEQSRGMPADGGAIAGGLGIADCGLRIEEPSMGETRYGAFSLVALEVVGVPVRRKPAIDDELSWLWNRERRLEEVRVQLANERRWAEWELLCVRSAKVRALADSLWRRWTERDGVGVICKALVVVNEGRAGR